MTATMQPLGDFPAGDRRRVAYVLADIDDTLTDDGLLGAAAFGAMHDLAAAGFPVIPVTGRPAGWCDHIARTWPVAAVVGENGAFTVRYDRQARRMISAYARDMDQRARDRASLDRLADTILATVPGAGIASDQAYRVADLAIDYCEDVAPLPDAAVDAIVAAFQAVGAHAKVSSIHVNGWFGDYDKLSMTRRLFAEQFGAELEDLREQIVFVGDSPNDAPMFGYFPNAVGVANLARFTDRLDARPRWLTRASGGAGFAELAQALLAVR